MNPHIDTTYGLADSHDSTSRRAFLVTDTSRLWTATGNMKHYFDVKLTSHENDSSLSITMSGNDDDEGRYFNVRRAVTPENFEYLKTTLKELSTLSPSEAVLGLRSVLEQLPEGKDNEQ